MKQITHIYIIVLVLLGVSACTDFSNDVNDIKKTSGNADFTTYVALGGFYTSGFQDGALYKSGQEQSYPAIIAQQMGSANTKQPLMSDDIGGIAMAKQPQKRILKLTKDGFSPMLYNSVGNTTLENIYKTQGAFFNLSAPGVQTPHILAPNYGSPVGLTTQPISANPYFVRFASSPTTSILADAMAQSPTFFSLSAGTTDILEIARGGCTASFLPEQAFAQYYEMIVAKLTKGGAKGVIANIPDMTDLPFFHTIPNNALNLNKEQANQLTQFFKVITSVGLQTFINYGVSPTIAVQLSKQYELEFKEGNNRFLIAVERTAQNPLGFRQMTSEEILLLSVDREAIKNNGYGSIKMTQEVQVILGKIAKGITPTLEEMQKVVAIVHPIQDKDVLDMQELTELKDITSAYNTRIFNLAKKYHLALCDTHTLFQSLKNKGLVFNGVRYNSHFIKGGFYSLDGFSPNSRGYAIIANHFIQSINVEYGSNLQLVDVSRYSGIIFP